ncbi:MAG: MmgE/PrpD family protein, partial [Gammaproteobacteria bacterium]|nr:MmgE/PrpD family protein [Gammaproteobacteria bacterium]
MSVTQQLVEFAVNTSYDDLPESVVDVVKLGNLNIIGTCLGGYQTRIGQMHVDIAREFGVAPAQATLIGDGSKVSIPFAAYANGNLGFALDYEDMIYYILHPGYITIAAALAVGEDLNVSGRDYIAAIALGYEVAGRIGVSMQPTAERGSQVWGEQYHPFASAVTAGRLLGLTVDEMNVAFGIAGTYASVPSVFKYFGPVEQTRPMREAKLGWGWQCMAGVMAAISAKKGFRGGHGILDGEHGFWIMAGSDRCDFDRMVAGLGRSWVTDDTEYKIHPSIGWNHAAFWAAHRLVEEHDIKAADVQGVHIKSFMAGSLADTAPSGPVDAMFSLPYTVCSTLMREPLVPELYSDEKLQDPELRRLLSVTECEHDTAADHYLFDEQRMCQTVTLKLANGTTVSKALEFPRDKPDYGRAQIENKFHDLSSGVLSEEKRAGLIEVIDRLETLA